MSKDADLMQKIEEMDAQLREIFKMVNTPVEKMNLMQLRVAAYRKINTAVEQVDRLLEIIETEFITIDDEEDLYPSVIFLNKQQEEERNDELREICVVLREIRWTLISHPENYQNDNKGELDTGS